MTQIQAMQILLYEALAEPIGLLVASSDPPRALARLQLARREARDAELACLIIRQSPLPDGDIVITKVKVEIPAQIAGQVVNNIKLDAEDLDLE